MQEKSKDILALIPARGGSKSIPLKNIASLNGRPLITYVIEAAKRCRSLKRIICSTEDQRIDRVCREAGVEVMKRPTELSRDETPITEVMLALLHTLERAENYIPFAIALLQPTSPFVLPEHIDSSAKLLVENPHAGSIQTVTKIPHNYHAYNQRVVTGDQVRFCFPEERAHCYNKQTKPSFFKFGNLIITRTDALLKTGNVFAEPSLANEIPLQYALDVDGPDDLELAGWYLSTGKVMLPDQL
jgi:CMP-N,N'-diacetyllegionaminic acid synthase